MGNVRSIYNAFEKIGASAKLSRDESDILNADGVVLPGVGAFPQGMLKLKSFNLDKIICQYVKTSKPLLGICLGMQMLFSKSTEFGITSGLNLIEGEIVSLNQRTKKPSIKLPHVGWNEIIEPTDTAWKDTILEDLDSNTVMYFVHSYVAVPEYYENILATSIYEDIRFTSSVIKDNILGCQFHPEKSAEDGLKIINNFVNLCRDNQHV